MNISKEEFCKIMEQLKEYQDKYDKICGALGAVVDIGDLSDIVIKLLEKLMNVPVYKAENGIYEGSDISYFMYEIDFGRAWTPDSITEIDGTPIDISTAEKLYDYLLEETSKT